MSLFFTGAAPSYADEQLSTHLSALSTLPIAPSNQLGPASSNEKPSPSLHNALHELSSSKPPSRDKIIEVLQSLSQSFSAYDSEIDELAEAEVMGRIVVLVWKEVLQVLLDGALALEEERSWWENTLIGRRGVGVYLVQTLPHRLFSAIPPWSDMPALKAFKFPSPTTIFKPVRATPTAALSAITSPYALTRREMLASRRALANARDDTARKIGMLASQGPQVSDRSITASELSGETLRIFNVLCKVVEIPPPPPPSTKRSRQSATPPLQAHQASPQNILNLLERFLPRSKASIDHVLDIHSRPSALTRFWFPLLFLPPIVYFSADLIVRNKGWMKEQVKNARETARGFIVQWVWEPLEGIGKTLRGGGEGLGVAPTTVKSDQESLERMVLDLGRDYYHMSPPELSALELKIRSGDMEEVLRVYEKEMQSPVKNALLGSLIRTLLIQVQKTKTDLSLSLLSLDHLLRSQQLTFAFVGVAPSVLVLYGLGGYLRALYKGEKRGKSRRRKYFNGMRDVERILLTAPKNEQELSERERGLLIVSVSGMRTWAAGLGSTREPFLEDLRMVENPYLSRGDKLRVIERIWRCWGVDGRKPH